MNWKKLLVAGLATAVAMRVIKSQVKRYEKRVELSDNLNRWEGEGGNVPQAAPPSLAQASPLAQPSTDGDTGRRLQ